MEEQELAELHDWELLQKNLEQRKKELEQPNYDSDAGAIKPDYFSLDSATKYPKRTSFNNNYSEQGEEEENLFDSDNPSWVDPESFTPKLETNEFWSDESSYSLDHAAIEGIGEINSERREISNMGSDEIGEIENKERERRWVEWWKMPFEVIKLCVLRVKPVWSLSIAAAILGVVILGKKLFKGKSHQQSRSVVSLKIVFDEKKATQLKARAARLNEAFSVVKRVPLIRASFPASGVTPWPIIGLY